MIRFSFWHSEQRWGQSKGNVPACSQEDEQNKKKEEHLDGNFWQ